MFTRFSDCGNSIHKIIPLLKKEILKYPLFHILSDFSNLLFLHTLYISNIQSASEDDGCGLFMYRIQEGFHINLWECLMYGNWNKCACYLKRWLYSLTKLIYNDNLTMFEFSSSYTHTHTHTHTQYIWEREREREREMICRQTVCR